MNKRLALILWALAAPVSALEEPALFEASAGQGKTAQLIWRNSGGADLGGLLIIRSSAPVEFVPAAYAHYPAGMSAGNGMVVYNAPAWPLAFQDSLPQTFTTYYYMAFARDSLPQYSAGLIASVYSLPAVDTLAPREVPCVILERAPEGAVSLSWNPVRFNADGSSIEDLTGYRVERSSAFGGVRESAAVLPPSATYFVINPGGEYFYSVRALDYSGNLSGDSILWQSSPEPTAWVIKNSACLGFSGAVMRRFFGHAGGILLDVRRVSAEENQIVLRSYVITAQSGLTAQGGDIPLNAGEFEAVFAFADPVFPAAGFGAQRFSSRSNQSVPVSPEGAAVYWFNGVEWVRLGGSLDAGLRTVSVHQPNAGRFQVRRSAAASGLSMNSSDVRPRMITPNGDNRNDFAIFYFSKPPDASIKGKIMDINGAFVADIHAAGPVPGGTLRWDGKDFNGNVVPTGVYIYRLESSGQAVSGRLVVMR